MDILTNKIMTYKIKICKLGYINDIESETQLRSHSSLWWFKDTIMVFRKIKNKN